MSKKRPLNFEAPSFSRDATDDALGLGMPPVPTEGESRAPVTQSEGTPPMMAPAKKTKGARSPTATAAPSENAAFIYFLAIVATVLWIGGLSAYSLGFRGRVGPFEDEPFAIAVLVVLGLAPVGLIWIGAYALRQGARLMGEAARLQRMAHDMVAPAALAAAEAGGAVAALRGEIQGAAAAADKARADLLHMRDLLAHESERLIEMAAGAANRAQGLVQTLGRERQEFNLLTGRLDNSVGEIGDAIARHAKMVGEASDLAQTQIQEAEAALAARAADLAAAAGEASEAARMAGDDLSRQAARLEQAGVTVGEQVQVMEEGLSQQRAQLVALAHGMRAEQEDLAVHFESQRAQFNEVLRQSEQATTQIGEAAQDGAESLRDLLAAATEQLREMSDQAQTERDLLGGAALQSLGALSEAAAFERRALEDEARRTIDELAAAAEGAHRAAESAGAAARMQVDEFNQAAMSVADTADAAFEQRLTQARALIEQSSSLVDEAGLRNLQKLELTVGQAYTAVDHLQERLSELEARAQGLPNAAQERGEEIRRALDSANESLLESARHAAGELEKIDNAFQERVKRNYEMLSEAVRLMGVLGGQAGGRGPSSTLTPRPAPQPAAPPSVPLRPRSAPPAATPPVAAEDEEQPDIGLRPRLKLTPADLGDEEDEAPPAPPGESSDPDWSWNELVAALDENDADDAELERALISQIDALGIDASALIPRRRLDDIARLYEGGDTQGAREIIHRLAPAAVRKLARRVLSDKLMRAQAERLIDRYNGLLSGVARRGSEGLTAANLLSSDAGRAFLLLDAAVGDLD